MLTNDAPEVGTIHFAVAICQFPTYIMLFPGTLGHFTNAEIMAMGDDLRG